LSKVKSKNILYSFKFTILSKLPSMVKTF